MEKFYGNCLKCLFFFPEIGQVDQESIVKTDIMQLLTNLLFLLAHQLCTTSGLRVIDNGLGLLVADFESDASIVDFALLSADQTASLPSQVQPICHFWLFAFSVHHLLVCNFGCFSNQPPILSTSPSEWNALDFTVYGPCPTAWKREWSIQINGIVTSRFLPQI